MEITTYAKADLSAKLLRKTESPRMLKNLISTLKPEQQPPDGFRKCGLSPVDREQVMPSIEDSQSIACNVDEHF